MYIRITGQIWRERNAFVTLGISLIFLMSSLIFSVVVGRNTHGKVLAASATRTEPEIMPAPLFIDSASMAVTRATMQDSSAGNDDLADSIATWGKQQTGSSWGVDVKPISGTTVSAAYGAETTFGTASIFKLYLIYAIEKTLPYETWSTTKVGESKTYRECVEAMLAQSDNPCADAIASKIGWSKIHKIINAAGYSQTNFNTVPLASTAGDTTRFLADLYTGKLLSPEATKFVLESMERSIFRKGLAAGCGDCTVLNKTGDADGYRNDVGIITVGERVFALSVYSKGGTNLQIAAVTKLVTDYVKSR